MVIKRFLCLAFVFFFSGIFCVYCSNFLSILLICAGVGWHLHKFNNQKSILLGFVFAGCFILGMLRMGIHQHQWPSLRNKEGTIQTITGKILKKEEVREKTYYTIAQQGYQVLLISNTNRYPIHATVVANGPLKYFQLPSNDGGYNEQLYYEGKNIAFSLFDVEIQMLKKSKLPIGEGLACFRRNMVKSINKNLSPQNAGTLIAMITGEKQYLDEETKLNYQESGIAHLLAISGTHLSILILGIYQGLRKCKWSYGKASFLSAIILCCFSVMSGMAVSTLRAGVMVLLYLLSQFLGMNYDAYTGMAVAGFYLLLSNPNSFLSISFQFSFLAVFAAITGGKILKKYFKKLHPLISTLFISFIIMLFILPLSLYSSYQVSIYQVLLNGMILPTAGILIGFGMLGAILGTLTGVIGKIILAPCDILLSMYGNLSKWSLKLPGAIQITGCPPFWKISLYFMVLLLILYLERKIQMTESKERWIKKIASNVKQRRLFEALIIVMMIIVLICGNSSRRTRITILDVGQGDGIYLQDDEFHYMIDGGSTSNLKIGTNTILPYLGYHGIRKIDAWFISHCDTDHLSGLLQIVEKNYPVKKIIFSEKVEKNKNYQKIVVLAKQKNIPIDYWKENSILGKKELTIQCPFLVKEEEKYDANERSMWLKITGNDGFKGIFAGDISSKVEQEYMEKKKSEEITFLKVAHHGSKYSNSSVFLEFCKPKLAVISAGRNNQYGHPSDETLERLKNGGINWLQTMDSGQIDLFLDTLSYRQKKIEKKYN